MDAIDHLALAEVALLEEPLTPAIGLALESIRRARMRLHLEAMVTEAEQLGLYELPEHSIAEGT